MEEQQNSEFTPDVYTSNKQQSLNAREGIGEDPRADIFEIDGEELYNKLMKEKQDSVESGTTPVESVKDDAEIRSRAAKLTDDIASLVQENFMDIMFGRYKQAPDFKEMIESANVDAENLLKILIAFEKPQAQLHEVVNVPESEIGKKYSEFMKPVQQQQLNDVLSGLVNDIKSLYTDPDIELVSSKITSLFNHIEEGDIKGQ